MNEMKRISVYQTLMTEYCSNYGVSVVIAVQFSMSTHESVALSLGAGASRHMSEDVCMYVSACVCECVCVRVRVCCV